MIAFGRRGEVRCGVERSDVTSASSSARDAG
jgi:hypothetical protein